MSKDSSLEIYQLLYPPGATVDYCGLQTAFRVGSDLLPGRYNWTFRGQNISQKIKHNWTNFEVDKIYFSRYLKKK